MLASFFTYIVITLKTYFNFILTQLLFPYFICFTKFKITVNSIWRWYIYIDDISLGVVLIYQSLSSSLVSISPFQWQPQVKVSGIFHTKFRQLCPRNYSRDWCRRNIKSKFYISATKFATCMLLFRDYFWSDYHSNDSKYPYSYLRHVL